MEPWQIALVWIAVQVLQTFQVWLLGRKVTRTLIPPPFLAPQQPTQPQPSYRTCRACGELRPVGDLSESGLCSDCGITQPTAPRPPRRLR